MRKSDKLEGLQDIVEYYTGLVSTGNFGYLDNLLVARDKLNAFTADPQDGGAKAVVNMIKKRIYYLKTKIAWGEDVNFDKLSSYARGFTAGQNTCYGPDIYFLQCLSEELEKK